MSVVLDKPQIKTGSPEVDQFVVTWPNRRTQPGYQPTRNVDEEVPAKVRRRTGQNAAKVVANKVVLFCAVFGVAYVASALSGNYMVEKSRNLGIEANSRANAATQAQRDVQRRLDVATSSATIEDWALSHSFRPTDGLAQTSKGVNLVATNK